MGGSQVLRLEAIKERMTYERLVLKKDGEREKEIDI